MVIDNFNLKGFDLIFTTTDVTKTTTTYKFRNGFSVEDEIENTEFFHIIYQGDIIALVEKLKVSKIKSSPDTYGGKGYDKFDTSEEVLLIVDGEVNKFKFRKKDFIRIAPDEKKKIDKFIDTNKLDLDNRRHVVVLLAYIEDNLIE